VTRPTIRHGATESRPSHSEAGKRQRCYAQNVTEVSENRAFLPVDEQARDFFARGCAVFAQGRAERNCGGKAPCNGGKTTKSLCYAEDATNGQANICYSSHEASTYSCEPEMTFCVTHKVLLHKH